MFVAVDARVPIQALSYLEKYARLILVRSEGIVYPEISGHPDIFICKTGDELIIAPNTPYEIEKQLIDFNIQFTKGEAVLGRKYPQTAHYNAVVTNHIILHQAKITDKRLLNHCKNHSFIEVKQAYTRCNTLALENDRFITSDRGIEKALLKNGFDTLFVSPEGVVLQGFEHGFFGGCCGVDRKNVFITGSLSCFPEGEKVRSFLSGYGIIELYDGPLFDGGGLIFLPL